MNFSSYLSVDLRTFSIKVEEKGLGKDIGHLFSLFDPTQVFFFSMCLRINKMKNTRLEKMAFLLNTILLNQKPWTQHYTSVPSQQTITAYIMLSEATSILNMPTEQKTHFISAVKQQIDDLISYLTLIKSFDYETLTHCRLERRSNLVLDWIITR